MAQEICIFSLEVLTKSDGNPSMMVEDAASLTFEVRGGWRFLPGR